MGTVVNAEVKNRLQSLKEQFKNDYIFINIDGAVRQWYGDVRRYYYWLNEDKFVYFYEDFAVKNLEASIKNKTDFSKFFTVIDEEYFEKFGIKEDWRDIPTGSIIQLGIEIICNPYKDEELDENKELDNKDKIDVKIDENKEIDKVLENNKNEIGNEDRKEQNSGTTKR